jgi:erythromycin esterase
MKIFWLSAIILCNCFYYSDAQPSKSHHDSISSWLQMNCLHIDSNNINQSSSNRLHQIFRKAEIILLGEATHGSKEVFQIKKRMIEFLVRDMKFRLIALEVNMPEAKLINDYILYSTGDLKSALRGVYFWTVENQEMLDMLEWLHQFNKTTNNKVQVYGIDMQYPLKAMVDVRSAIAIIDSTFLPIIDSCYNWHYQFNFQEYKIVRKWGREWNRCNDSQKRQLSALAYSVYSHISKHRHQYIKKSSLHTVAQLEKDAEIAAISLQNSLILGTNNFRDSCMAENVEWIRKQHKKGKIIVWAHNLHVSKRKLGVNKRMGFFLHEQYPHSTIHCGFLFHSGTYTAKDRNGMHPEPTSHIAQVSMPGSVEWQFHESGLISCIVDIRMPTSELVKEWLNKYLMIRAIGAMEEYQQFYSTIVSEDFDTLVYIDATTAIPILK